jgi:A/G-specific adenine glycosylase
VDAAVKRSAEPERCRWLTLRELSGAALPSLMRKVIAHALNE